MEYWTLRRHLLELKELLGAHPLLIRAVDLAPRGLGLILRTAAQSSAVCCALFGEGEEQGVFFSDAWQENPHESGLSRRINQACRDARIGGIEILGRDRVARFGLQARDPFFQQVTRFTLVGEFTGRIGNLLLLDAEGIVLEQSRVTSNNHPKAPYSAPAAPGGAVEPTCIDDADLAAILAAPPSSWGDRLLGISPLFRRELAHRLSLPQFVAPVAVFRALLEEAGNLDSSVFLCLESGKLAALVPFRPHHLAGKTEMHEFARVNEALAWLDECIRRPRRLDTLRERARGGYARELEKRETVAAYQRDRIREFENAERLRHLGELLQSHLHEVPPRATHIVVKDWTEDAEVEIPLDPVRTPIQNAQRYFHQYKKAKRGLSEAARRLQELSEEIAWIKEQVWYCETANSEADLEALVIRPGAKKQARMSGSGSGKKRSGGGNTGPVRDARRAKALSPLVEIDGCRFFVGRNGRQNDLVTFGVGKRGDVWAHANDVPGAHIVAKRPGGIPTSDDAVHAAVLAAWFSFARGSGKVPVDVTDIAHVKRIPGGGPGRVSYTHQRTLHVNPRDALTWVPEE
ncbi:MAG: NFACT family protein [Candidatus Ozemobacteraceae bacterium]